MDLDKEVPTGHVAKRYCPHCDAHHRQTWCDDELGWVCGECGRFSLNRGHDCVLLFFACLIVAFFIVLFG